ncbi:hypothetical protein WN66_06184 [Saccharomyces cerevisiae]|uniref:Putative uncharacterized protein YOR335W-A n=2 Tax=Saccharomyces cerevisiae TaxID=4932 RepID=YO335_YEAST|nr:RecName: Full=Putative uncharacterized protein YOR335W-A [Saccharomyces cerevisiae S288C]AAL79294.1 unknown [Saccharomyces cerevisiae]KZV08227.1 hypothetical protein WN66_06184 [Saccharomyces cerevisiae]CAY86617.1 EC1118_1O4_5798p [Saccharomyces cerevisiae EC1118]
MEHSHWFRKMSSLHQEFVCFLFWPLT